MLFKNARRKRKKLPFTELTLDIHRLSHEGRGIGEHEGQVVFVDQALPGERITCEVKSRRSNYLSGVATQVLQASALRQAPPCPHFKICGGCSLQHMKPEAQIEFKQAVVKEMIEHLGETSIIQAEHLAPPIIGPTEGYRYKARLAVKYVEKKGGVLVGFREAASHFIAQIDSCSVLHPAVSGLIEPLKQMIGVLAARSTIPQIEVAVGEQATGESRVALVFRHLEPLSAQDQGALSEFARTHQLDVYLQPKGPDTVHKLWPNDGQARLYYSLDPFDLRLAFHPTDFTQINPFINVSMVSQAIEWLDIKIHEKILDLFCGLGNFTLALARRASEVVGVEGSSEMVNRAKQNAQANQISHCEFYAADLYDPDTLNEQQPSAPWLNRTFDKLLLDPPRSGADRIIKYLPRWDVRALVYVSCNPSTLARDASLLKGLGYRLSKLCVMDMFAHTRHVESMALFLKR